jgi:hypothetical protein
MNVPLSIVLWLPLAAAIIGAFTPRLMHRGLTLGGMAAVLGWAVGTLVRFDGDGGREVDGLQNVTDITWIKPLGIHYKLGLDGLNLALIAMTALLFLVCLIWALMREEAKAGPGTRGPRRPPPTPPGARLRRPRGRLRHPLGERATLLDPVRGRRDCGLGCVHGSGSAAVHRLL